MRLKYDGQSSTIEVQIDGEISAGSLSEKVIKNFEGLHETEF